ncbi:toxin-antitoxin system YwqK family antitoxin [Flavobacterium adhaerens]|uniref:toxin-antitoxin system YwqK family antitoxin n=1 Tax=Flavobacterium adhaerens TaxID=3149043 RepID=UPI0032B558EB
MSTIFRFLALFFFGQIVFCQSANNPVDQMGKKHGVWKGFYKESGRQRYEGTFEHGKEVGIFKFFDDTKAQSVIATRTFEPNNNSCYTIFYDQNKNIVSEGKEVNKLREGVWKYYHKASKEIMTIENYKNGKLDGTRTVYYPSGKIVDEVVYKNGLKEGVYKKYSESGIVLENSFFKNGEYDGEAVYKDPNDLVIAKGMFKNGKKVGKWQFFVNGKLESEENMDKPKKIELKKDRVKN